VIARPVASLAAVRTSVGGGECSPASAILSLFPSPRTLRVRFEIKINSVDRSPRQWALMALLGFCCEAREVGRERAHHTRDALTLPSDSTECSIRD